MKKRVVIAPARMKATAITETHRHTHTHTFLANNDFKMQMNVETDSENS